MNATTEHKAVQAAAAATVVIALGEMCTRMLTAHELAQAGVSDDSLAAVALDAIAAIMENCGRTLDQCVGVLGGTPTGNFDAINNFSIREEVAG